MTALLDAYAGAAGEGAVEQLRQLARPLEGRRIVHVNSTKSGGGVAEILEKLVPLTRELGIDATWEVLEGNDDFYRCTKAFHNGLQGADVKLSRKLLDAYEETNAENAGRLAPALRDADFVFIHDPQPAPLLSLIPDRKGIWLWRCHIDLSRPNLDVWRYLVPFVEPYNASIFSLDAFARKLPHPRYLIPPSIDPLSAKNEELPEEEIAAVRDEFGLDPDSPMILQVSRFDRFKDPVGVVQAYRLARKFSPGLQLVLAGGTATDDPEGEEVLEEVREAGQGDPGLHILLLPPDAHRTINALQRSADIVLQKSLKEGFGLTVTEGMWKGKPVIGGKVGGIRLQLVDYQTGFLVSSPEGAALRIRQLLRDRKLSEEIGVRARELVRSQFLLTRLLREHLSALHALDRGRHRLDLTRLEPVAGAAASGDA